MKRLLITAQFIALLLCLMAQIAIAQDNEPFSINKSPLPKPTSPVMDYAGVLDSSTKQRVEQSILKLKEETNPSVELAVAIVKTTGDRPIFDYSIAVARGWGIGSRKQDNPGALLFIAVEDRKYFTQVSSDLEDELPDGLVGSLQRQYLVPQFRLGNYGKGVEDTIDAYIKAVKQQQSGKPITGKSDGFRGYDDVGDYAESNWDGMLICLIIIVILIIIIMSNSGGGGGGKRKRNSNDSSWFYVPTSSGSDWGSSGGSSWGGGGSSGGGWGGFGGGGDFGGGGAGGGW